VTWLLNYDPEDRTQLVGIRDKAEALRMIARWVVR
jgi:hypothetical protein